MFKQNPCYRHTDITIQSLRRNIRLNVVRSLNQFTTADPIVRLNQRIGELTVDEMTSKDYANDLRAHYRAHENKLRDTVYIDTFRTVILGNSHLFKDKVNFFFPFKDFPICHCFAIHFYF